MGEKFGQKVVFFGDRYTKTKTSSLTQLFKDFTIKAVNVEKNYLKHAESMFFKILIFETLKNGL